MTIFLRTILPMENQQDYKVHFARWNKHSQPLDVLVRDRNEWRAWQEYRPARNDFNRPLIFSLAQFYYETDVWMFGGVFRVLQRHPDRYEVELTDIGQEYIGRLKLFSPYRGRTTRPTMERHYQEFQVTEILREPFSGKKFPGYNDIDISFSELEILVENDRRDWRIPLEGSKGVYLITDTGTRRQYIGAAYGADGIWSRWCQYVGNGHGGNLALRQIVNENGIEYCRENYRFALLEDLRPGTPDDIVTGRETFWKKILMTRGVGGLNRN